MGALNLIIEMEGVGHRSFMENYFSSSQLLFRSTQWENKQLWYYYSKCKGHSSKFYAKDIEADLLCQVERNCADCWKDKWEVCLVANMQQPPASEHYVDEEGNASKSLCTENYGSNMGFVDISDVMSSGYSIFGTTWKWTKETILPCG